MIVSWNELQRTCQKAFRGLGVPAGADDDGSFAVLWLQARGLDALTPLEAALSALESAPPRPLQVVGGEDGVDVVDGGGQSAVSVASDALDLAVARAVELKARVELLLTGVEGGIFVAGVLAQRPAPGRCASVQWRDGETRCSVEVASDGACRLCTVRADGAERDGGRVPGAIRIVIDEPGRGRWTEGDRSRRTEADDAELERRAMRSVTLGIEVPDPLWARLLAFAKLTLVPATHASRKRGAGGGEYND